MTTWTENFNNQPSSWSKSYSPEDYLYNGYYDLPGSGNKDLWVAWEYKIKDLKDTQWIRFGLSKNKSVTKNGIQAQIQHEANGSSYNNNGIRFRSFVSGNKTEYNVRGVKNQFTPGDVAVAHIQYSSEKDKWRCFVTKKGVGVPTRHFQTSWHSLNWSPNDMGYQVITANGDDSGATSQYETVDLRSGYVHVVGKRSWGPKIAANVRDSTVQRGATAIGPRKMATLDDFEDNDLAEWSTYTGGLSITNNRSESGSLSFKVNKNNVPYKLAERPIDGNKRRFVVHYREVRDSNGHGYDLVSSSGNRVTGFCTANPQWRILKGDGSTTKINKSGYKRWHEVTIDLNYNFGVASYTWKDSGGATKRRVVSLVNNEKPDKLVLTGAQNGSSLSDQNAGGEVVAWTDNIRVSVPPLGAPSNVTASPSSNDVNLSWSSATNAEGYNILRAPYSGGSYSQIASVGSGTTSYTDWNLDYAEDYAYKIESYL